MTVASSKIDLQEMAHLHATHSQDMQHAEDARASVNERLQAFQQETTEHMAAFTIQKQFIEKQTRSSAGKLLERPTSR